MSDLGLFRTTTQTNNISFDAHPIYFKILKGLSLVATTDGAVARYNRKSQFGWFSQARHRAMVAAAITLVCIGIALFVNDAYNDESEKVTWPTVAATENEVRVDKHSHSCGENCSDNRYHVEV